MKELATYIEEGFYKNSGAHDTVVNAKLTDFFGGNYPAWIKDKTGFPLNNYVVGLFLAYICRCFDFNLGDKLIIRREQSDKPFYIQNERDMWKANISGTQFNHVKSFKDDIVRIDSVSDLSQLDRSDQVLKTKYIDVKGEKYYKDKYRLCTASFNLRDCTADLEKILNAAKIKYEVINTSSTGRAKVGNWIVVDDFKNYLK